MIKNTQKHYRCPWKSILYAVFAFNLENLTPDWEFCCPKKSVWIQWQWQQAHYWWVGLPVPVLKIGELEDCKVGELEDWRVGELEDLRVGGLEDWMVAGLEDWRVGGMDWKVGGLEVHWQQKRLFLPALQHQVYPSQKNICIDYLNISSSPILPWIIHFQYSFYKIMDWRFSSFPEIKNQDGVSYSKTPFRRPFSHNFPSWFTWKVCVIHIMYGHWPPLLRKLAFWIANPPFCRETLVKGWAKKAI